MTIHYFDSLGRWVAFRKSNDDKNVFSPDAK